MADGHIAGLGTGDGAPLQQSSSSPSLDGALLLQLLQKQPQPSSIATVVPGPRSGPPPQQEYFDPAVAAIGPAFNFLLPKSAPPCPISPSVPRVARNQAPPGFGPFVKERFSLNPQSFDLSISGSTIRPPKFSPTDYSSHLVDRGHLGTSNTNIHNVGTQMSDLSRDFGGDRGGKQRLVGRPVQVEKTQQHRHDAASIKEHTNMLRRTEDSSEEAAVLEVTSHRLERSSQKDEVHFATPLNGDGVDLLNGDAFDDDVLDSVQETIRSLLHVDDSEGRSVLSHAGSSSRNKDYRSDFSRGHRVSNQRIRIQRSGMQCRRDIDMLTPGFLSIFESLVPSEEEKMKQKHLLVSLKRLINEVWPNAQLHLYGSCANSFGVSSSDIDLCLDIDDTGLSKSDIVLRLADILVAGNLQNVQALTRARVPIVKLVDPDTGLACDICINNLLAVVNTKLLRDYGRIDPRLRQLAFVVKHWAKCRRVNETYQGTLSSYAYVIMCIHLMQMRRPAILPCLQAMEPTFAVTVDCERCWYFDRVEELQGFGAQNNESLGRLVWAFFHYWAYQHDYTNSVISIRLGSIISKGGKDWTRRIGNDRHLICIEDPFETSHDLGRVVDKFSIKILREEFERAANILQYDRNPIVTLFEPYVRPE